MTRRQKKKKRVKQQTIRVERELGELKEIVGGIAGDLVKLRDYVVTKFELRPPFSLPFNQITQAQTATHPPFTPCSQVEK